MLAAVTGSFSLEGGSDGGSSAASVFHLVESPDEFLDCNGVTVTREGSGTTPQVTVRRLATNASADEPCDTIPYTLGNAPSSARFLKPLVTQTTAQFVADFVWTASPTAGTTALPPTKVDFETGTSASVTIGWCPDPLYDGVITIGGVQVPKLVGIADPLNNPAAIDLDEFAGKQFACVGVQTARVIDNNPLLVTGSTDSDSVKIVEQIYVLGDIKFQR
jgi:hypothetical protein